MSKRIAYGWLDTVTPPLWYLLSDSELRKLPVPLVYARNVKVRRDLQNDTVYVRLTEALTREQSRAIKDDLIVKQGQVKVIWQTKDLTGFLFVATDVRGKAYGAEFLDLVAQAFAELRFVTKFTSDYGHEEFMAMK